MGDEHGADHLGVIAVFFQLGVGAMDGHESTATPNIANQPLLLIRGQLASKGVQDNGVVG